jgi:hypothetical protein
VVAAVVVAVPVAARPIRAAAVAVVAAREGAIGKSVPALQLGQPFSALQLLPISPHMQTIAVTTVIATADTIAAIVAVVCAADVIAARIAPVTSLIAAAERRLYQSGKLLCKVSSQSGGTFFFAGILFPLELLGLKSSLPIRLTSKKNYSTLSWGRWTHTLR